LSLHNQIEIHAARLSLTWTRPNQIHQSNPIWVGSGLT